MNTTKTMILSIAVLVMLSMLLFAIRFLLRKMSTLLEERRPSICYVVWFASIFISGSLLVKSTIAVFAEAIDNIYKINPAGSLLGYFKTGSLLCGLTILWLVAWYFVSNTLSAIITGKGNIMHEAAEGNYSYLIVRGAILPGFIICLQPVFELILRTFIPHIEVPFYH